MEDDGLIDTQIGAFKEKKLFKRSSLFQALILSWRSREGRHFSQIITLTAVSVCSKLEEWGVTVSS